MPTPSQTDLLEASKMSLGAHLGELRIVLVRAGIGLVIGVLISLYFASSIVEMLLVPIREAQHQFQIRRAQTLLQKKYGDQIPVESLNALKAGLVPAGTIQVEPYTFLKQLRQEYPQDFGKLTLTPFQFSLSDLKKESGSHAARQLCQQLLAVASAPSKQTTGPVARQQILWKLCTTAQQQLIKKLATQKSLTPTDRVQLTELFNQLINQPALHRSAAWSEASFLQAYPKSVQKLGKTLTQSFDPDQSRRLNKLLLSQAYDQTFHPARFNLLQLPTWKQTHFKVQTLSAQEAFFVWFKAALYLGIGISFPWIFWQGWLFVSAGLYEHEKKSVYFFLPLSMLLFLGGVFLAIFYVYQPVLEYLFHFNLIMDLDPDIRISEWVGFALFLPLGFGVSFQLPLVMLLLNQIGIFPIETYYKNWRLAILVIFFCSMILTPADPVSMVLMAFPLTFLYFLGIGLCYYLERKKTNNNPFEVPQEL